MFGKLCYREKMLVAFAHPVFEKERVGIVVSVPDKGQSVVGQNPRIEFFVFINPVYLVAFYPF